MPTWSLWKHFSIGCYMCSNINLSGITGRESRGMQTFLYYLAKILGLRFNFSSVLEIKDHSSRIVRVYIYYILLLKLKIFDIYRMSKKWRSPMTSLIYFHVYVCVYMSVSGRVLAWDEQGLGLDSLALGEGGMVKNKSWKQASCLSG